MCDGSPWNSTPLPCIELPNGRKIGDGQPAFVVAELGQNHNGDAYTALRMMKAAHDAGADALKLTKRHIADDLSAEAYHAPYEGPDSFGPTYGQHREALEMHPGEYRHLKDRLRYNEWPEVFFATACDRRSVDDLEEAIDPPLYKIASRDLDNLPLLDHVARLHKPVILSTGMAEPGELDDALETIRRHHDRVVVLYCTSQYPTPEEAVRLQAMSLIRARYDVLVGFSDHTRGIHLAQAAVCLGACVIEKHITLARGMPGSDHVASLEPAEFKTLVHNIRSTEAAMGPCRWPQSVPTQSRRKLGRSIVAAREIRAGQILREADLTLKSPGTGLRWRDRFELIGRPAARTIPADTLLSTVDVAAPTETPDAVLLRTA